MGLDGSLEVIHNLGAARSLTTGSAAAQQLDVVGSHLQTAGLFVHRGIAQLTNVQSRLSLLPELIQAFKVQGFHWLISCLVIS